MLFRSSVIRASICRKAESLIFPVAALELDAFVEPGAGVGAGLALGWIGRFGVFRLGPSALAPAPGAKAATGGKRLPELKPEPALLWLFG